jgi:hypothetical protein
VGHRLGAALLQIVVSAGRSSAALWDAQSGVFLGSICVYGQSADSMRANAEVNPDTGVAINATTGRAERGPYAPVPALGTPLPELSSPEEVTVGQKFNTAAAAAQVFATSFAKKCGLNVPATSVSLWIHRGHSRRRKNKRSAGQLRPTSVGLVTLLLGVVVALACGRGSRQFARPELADCDVFWFVWSGS